MTSLFSCPCGAVLDVADDRPGTRVRCPECAYEFDLPTVPPDASRSEGRVERPVPVQELDRLRAERQRLKRGRFWTHILGYVFWLLGAAIMAHAQRSTSGRPSDRADLLFWQGASVYLLGCCVALYKGRNPAWGLLGFLSCIGLLILVCLPDRNGKRLRVLRNLLAEHEPRAPAPAFRT
jgi:hypothetical protein